MRIIMEDVSYKLVLEKINDIVIKLRQGKDKDAYKDINEQMSVINEIFVNVIKDITLFKENGIDVSENIIMMQLENMMDGLKYKDDVKLADTLEYEISETIKMYSKIK